jgi:outer membrane protein OmpA-like peptidoglycan-associated protein
MKAFLATTCIATVALLAGGCATKKYVRNTTAPIQSKVDQVGEQTTRNGQQIEETRTSVNQVDQRAQSGISAAQERASAADAHAGEAMNRANQAAQAADQNAKDLGGVKQSVQSMSNVIANIDDYKLQTSTTVPFKFDKYALTNEAKQNLDKLVDDVKADKRFYIAIEGYTDKTGSPQYNEALSRRRADSVVQYLVGQKDIPIYRIHQIGLGQQKPVDEARSRDARAKNRRVEVRVFSADQVTASLGGGATSSGSSDRSGNTTPQP